MQYNELIDTGYDVIETFSISFHLQTDAIVTETMTSNATSDSMFTIDDGILNSFNKWYQGVHGYLSIIVCLFGLFSNVTNIVVLTRKSMSSPTNCLLTAVALADLLTMVSYLPYAAYFYCYSVLEPRHNHAKGWIIFMIFHINFVITCHTAAMWLTVVLAVFRYMVVCHHHHGPTFCNMTLAKSSIGIVFVSTILFCLPIYVVTRTTVDKSGEGFWVEKNDFIPDGLIVFNFWLFGVALKVAPCVLLTVLSCMLIRTMHAASVKRRKLRSPLIRRGSERGSVVGGDHNRTTTMLVAVVLSFVAAELPQGIIALLSGVDSDIFDKVYVPLGDVWDILGLVNSAVNFVLYCTMSRQFRNTFKAIFLRKPKNNAKHFVGRTQNETAYCNANIKMSVL